jgi:hypothetical protein
VEERLSIRDPGKAETETIELSVVVGCVNRVPPEIRVLSAVVKLSIPFAASARPEIVAVLAAWRAAMAASLGAASALVRFVTSASVSIPEPTPSVFRMDAPLTLVLAVVVAVVAGVVLLVADVVVVMEKHLVPADERRREPKL